MNNKYIDSWKPNNKNESNDYEATEDQIDDLNMDDDDIVNGSIDDQISFGDLFL